MSREPTVLLFSSLRFVLPPDPSKLIVLVLTEDKKPEPVITPLKVKLVEAPIAKISVEFVRIRLPFMVSVLPPVKFKVLVLLTVTLGKERPLATVEGEAPLNKNITFKVSELKLTILPLVLEIPPKTDIVLGKEFVLVKFKLRLNTPKLISSISIAPVPLIVQLPNKFSSADPNLNLAVPFTVKLPDKFKTAAELEAINCVPDNSVK
jgi:hypothetical protein